MGRFLQFIKERYLPTSRKSRRAYILAMVSVSAMLCIGVAGLTAKAATDDASNTIWKGLWEGVSMVTGDSTPSTVTGSTTGSSSGGFFGRGSTSSSTNTGTPTTAPTLTGGGYAALGDSVAAGLGLPSVSPASSQDTQCGRSSEAYPQTVARNKGLTLIFAACSGATAGDLSTQQRVSGANPQRQINAAFANGTPSLISVTAGANDVQWQNFIRKCYAATCGTSFDDTTSSALLAAMKLKLYYFLAEVQAQSAARGNTPPTVVLTGYYDPLSSQCETFTGSRITATESSWLQANVANLNNAIQQTANQFSFARYAAVDFTGHDLCSTDPWVQGLNDSAPIHPTASGQQAIAQAVLSASN